jgi:negative regulator of flagellin synthesis FlgM
LSLFIIQSRLKFLAEPPLYRQALEETIMKINQNVNFLNNGTSPGPVAPGKAKAATPAAPALPDQLRPSSSVLLLPSTTRDFDAVRVAKIRESISAGHYQVNTGKIADGLLSTVRDLLGKPAS